MNAIRNKFIHQNPFWLVELTWNQESANLVISCREWIVDPTASNEEPSLVIIVDIWQGSEAMNPQAEAIELSASDAIITHQPAGCRECNANANERNREHCYPTISCQRSTLHILPKIQNQTCKYY